MRLTYVVTPVDFANSCKISSSVKSLLKQLNIPPGDIKRIIVALYEAEVNMVAHSYGGEITCDIEAEQALVEALDVGPGIPDVGLAMTEGWSTATSEIRELGFGAGMGLPNIKKHTDELEIVSGKDSPTKISMKFYYRGGPS